VFANTTSKVIQKALKGGVVYAVNLKGFSGSVGKEITAGKAPGYGVFQTAPRNPV